jgi:hypothetical protein
VLEACSLVNRVEEMKALRGGAQWEMIAGGSPPWEGIDVLLTGVGMVSRDSISSQDGRPPHLLSPFCTRLVCTTLRHSQRRLARIPATRIVSHINLLPL